MKVEQQITIYTDQHLDNTCKSRATVHERPPSAAPDPPTIEGLDTVLKFDVGEAVNLTCVSGGGISPLVMTWYKNGVQMAGAEIRSGLMLSLVLQEEDDGAELLCQAANYVSAVNTSVVALIKEGALLGAESLFFASPSVEMIDGVNLKKFMNLAE